LEAFGHIKSQQKAILLKRPQTRLQSLFAGISTKNSQLFAVSKVQKPYQNPYSRQPAKRPALRVRCDGIWVLTHIPIILQFFPGGKI